MIKLKKVSKKILNNLVLNDINLNIEKGKIYLLLGLNGSGKTMLLRTICGLIKPTSGEIIKDKNIKYGVIIENPGFLYDETGYFNLKYLANINKTIDNDTIIKYMKKFDLYRYKDIRVKKYSLGMRQKLAIIQAIMEKPNCILLDEPFNALDDASVNLLIEELITLNRDNNTTIIIALHDIEKALKLSPYIKIFIKEGRIKQVISTY